ncbi:MAG: succinate dehydrogenase cytochrome b subunit [Desulfatibacillaceae bacterium]
MTWVLRTFGSSVGKKLLMALTGLGFCGFLVSHLAGNLTVYWGFDAFNSYAEHLHSLEPLVRMAEFGLATFAVIHVLTGLTLFYQNWTSRPNRYEVNRWGGGRTIFSATMPYTGLLILVFVGVHLATFKFADPNMTVSEVARHVFGNPAYVLFYVVSMVIVAFHVTHGFWSAFQTLGLNHPKYMPAIEKLSLLFGLIVALGYGSLPVVVIAMS